jgi:hypothetical protein
VNRARCVGKVHSTVEEGGIRTERRKCDGVKTSLSQQRIRKSKFVCALLCTVITQKNTSLVHIVGNFPQGHDK